MKKMKRICSHKTIGRKTNTKESALGFTGDSVVKIPSNAGDTV